MLLTLVSPVIRDLKVFRFLMTDEKSVIRDAKASDVYLENCIQRKSIDDKKYLMLIELLMFNKIYQDIRGISEHFTNAKHEC